MGYTDQLILMREDPVLFVEGILKAKPDRWQQEVMIAVASGARGVSIRSGHGVGKTSCLSYIPWLPRYVQRESRPHRIDR